MSAAAAISLLGMAYSINSANQQSADLLHSAQLQRQINEMNAEFILLDAWEAELAGFSQSARYQSVIDKTISAERVAFAFEGVDVTSGTALAVQQENKLVGRLNVIDMQRQARARSTGLKLQASSLRLGSDFQTTQAVGEAAAIKERGLLQAIQIGISNYDKF